MEERTRLSHSAEKMYEKTLQRAFRLLSYRPRTIAEMRGRLLEKEWAVPEIVEQVIARLQALNYLNDEDYAERFVTSRLERGAVGAIRLRRDLRQKHLPAPAIDQAVRQIYAEHPEEELIVAVTEKWLARKGAPATPADAQKLCAFLLRRGFSPALVYRTVRHCQSPPDSSVDPETAPAMDDPLGDEASTRNSARKMGDLDPGGEPSGRGWLRRSSLRRRLPDQGPD